MVLFARFHSVQISTISVAELLTPQKDNIEFTRKTILSSRESQCTQESFTFFGNSCPHVMIWLMSKSPRGSCQQIRRSDSSSICADSPISRTLLDLRNLWKDDHGLAALSPALLPWVLLQNYSPQNPLIYFVTGDGWLEVCLGVYHPSRQHQSMYSSHRRDHWIRLMKNNSLRPHLGSTSRRQVPIGQSILKLLKVSSLGHSTIVIGNNCCCSRHEYKTFQDSSSLPNHPHLRQKHSLLERRKWLE